MEEKSYGGELDKNCKAVEGDCPICFEVIRDGEQQYGKATLVWRKAACGQGVHKQCLDMWAKSKRQQGGDSGGAGKVTCPYCRSDWEFEQEEKAVDLANIKRGLPNSEGYVNVADQLGIRQQRNYSSYSSYWTGRPLYYCRRW